MRKEITEAAEKLAERAEARLERRAWQSELKQEKGLFRVRLLNPKLSILEMIFTTLGTLLGVGVCAALTDLAHLALLAPSFGASAVLLYAVPGAALSQPRNVIGGHFVSASVGVLIATLLGNDWLAITLGAVFAILVMYVTDTLHPPGGATAIIAITTLQTWQFVFMPITVGACILVVVSIVVNYFSPTRTYPVR